MNEMELMQATEREGVNYRKIARRLLQYENTDMSPDEIKNMVSQIKFLISLQPKFNALQNEFHELKNKSFTQAKEIQGLREKLKAAEKKLEKTK